MKRIRCRIRFQLLVVLLVLTSSSWANDPNAIKLPSRGEILPFSFEQHDMVLQIPEDYNDLNESPVIFYYHGQGGKPNVDYLKLVTESKGFVLVGMSYPFKSGTPMSSSRYISCLRNEVKRLGKLKRYMEKDLRLKIDGQQLYVSGISKGGWYSYDLFEYKPGPWAGALIIAAGRKKPIATPSGEMLRPFKDKPVYIGVGETDVNRKAAEGARRYLKRVGADVTYEIYEGLGHDVDVDSQVVREWLKERLKMTETEEG